MDMTTGIEIYPMGGTLLQYASRVTDTDVGRWKAAVAGASDATANWQEESRYRYGAQELCFKGQAILRYVVSIEIDADPRSVDTQQLLTWLTVHNSPAKAYDQPLQRAIARVLQEAGHLLPDPNSWHILDDPVVRLWRSLSRDHEGDGDPLGDLGGASMGWALQFAIDSINAEAHEGATQLDP
ncbi:MAG: hypothetical protein JWQ81_8481 [Amycolatopsis sp.]|nr:hypothetical protein [Amycolatopsis sp.]